MKKVFEAISAFFGKMKAKRAEHKQKELVSYANHIIQFKEFDEKLFIAYNGTPLFQVWEIEISTLNACRDAYIKYSEKHSNV